MDNHAFVLSNQGKYTEAERLVDYECLFSLPVLPIHSSLFTARQSLILRAITRGRSATSRVTRVRAWYQWEIGCAQPDAGSFRHASKHLNSQLHASILDSRSTSDGGSKGEWFPVNQELDRGQTYNRVYFRCWLTAKANQSYSKWWEYL